LLAVAYAFWNWRDQTLLTVGVLGALVLVYAALSFVTKKLGKLRFRETIARAGIELALAVLAPIFFGLHLLFTNRRYLARGRVTQDDAGTTTIGTPGMFERIRNSRSRSSGAATRTH
jgi:hypothetical protein